MSLTIFDIAQETNVTHAKPVIGIMVFTAVLGAALTWLALAMA